MRKREKLLRIIHLRTFFMCFLNFLFFFPKMRVSIPRLWATWLLFCISLSLSTGRKLGLTHLLQSNIDPRMSPDGNPFLCLKASLFLFTVWATRVAHLYAYIYIYTCIYMCIYMRRKWQPIPISLPGEFHGQRSLVAYSPWDREESDTTEQLSLNIFYLFFGCAGS